MLGVKAVLLISFAVGSVLSRETDYCYAQNKEPYLRMGTKTAYSLIHSDRTRYRSIPNCKPIQIWMLIRHGTRCPRPDEVERLILIPKLRDQIIYNHEVRGRGRLCDADLENLKLWHLDGNVRLETAGQLTEQGVKDLYQLGRRVKSNFPELFPPAIKNVTSQNYKFRLTSSNRVPPNKMAFMSGVFDGLDIQDKDIPSDTLPQPQFSCPRLQTKVDKKPKNRKEKVMFMEGPEYQNIISRISRRLGLPNNITADSMRNMWDMCRFDKAWKVDELSPWCAVFSEEELKVLEYSNDLAEYYRRGYGREFNLRVGCPLIKNMFLHFRKLERGDYSNEPRGIFSVGNSGHIYSFMTAMGFSKDDKPLLASDFRFVDQHQWRTSEIGSFATSIAAVFYKCNNTKSPNKVMFYLAERPVSYEGCDDGLCDWQYLKNKYPEAKFQCDLDNCYTRHEILFPALCTSIFLALLMLAVFIQKRLVKLILPLPVWLRQQFHKNLNNGYTIVPNSSSQVI